MALTGAQGAAAALLSGALLLVSACSSDNSATCCLPPTTETTVVPPTTAPGIAGTLDPETERLSQQFMEPVRAWRTAWVSCLADTAGCDFDTLVGPYVSGAAEDGFRRQVDDLKASSQNLRGADPDGVEFVQYGVTRQSPLRVEIEVCTVSDGTLVTADADGSEEIVADAPPFAQLAALVLEEQADGMLTIGQYRQYDETPNIKAENCDRYRR